VSWGLQKRNNAVSYTTTLVNYIVVVNERERKLGHRFSSFAQKALFSSYISNFLIYRHSSISAVSISAIFDLTRFIIPSYFPPLWYHQVTSIYAVSTFPWFVMCPHINSLNQGMSVLREGSASLLLKVKILLPF
jgi:hypothetical protein